MLHEPAVEQEQDLASGYKATLGVWMFIPFALVYACFVFINVLNPVVMEKTIFWGLNLAVVYGFGLIILALIMALIYNSLCNAREKRHQNESKEVK